MIKRKFSTKNEGRPEIGDFWSLRKNRVNIKLKSKYYNYGNNY